MFVASCAKVHRPCNTELCNIVSMLSTSQDEAAGGLIRYQTCLVRIKSCRIYKASWPIGRVVLRHVLCGTRYASSKPVRGDLGLSL